MDGGPGCGIGGAQPGQRRLGSRPVASHEKQTRPHGCQPLGRGLANT